MQKSSIEDRVWLNLFVIALDAYRMCSALCIQYCRNKNGLWIRNIWQYLGKCNVLHSSVVVNIHMDKKMVVDVRVCA
jgi:hypothetical protein